MAKKKPKSKILPKKKPSKTRCNGRRTGLTAYCKRPPGWGTDHKGEGRCKFHGGKSLRGPDSPRWKTGLYSKFAGKLPGLLAGDFAEAMDDPDSVDLQEEITLMRALIMRYLQQMKDSQADGTNINIKEMTAALSGLVDQRRRLVEVQLKKKQIEGEMINREEQNLILARLEAIIKNRLTSYPKILILIVGDIQKMRGIDSSNTIEGKIKK